MKDPFNKSLLRFSEEAIGDGSTQMWKFAFSLKCYANNQEPPEGFYPGDQIKALALDLAQSVPLDAPLWMWKVFGGNRIIVQQEQDLQAFGVTFDTWFRESDLHSPYYYETIEDALEHKNPVYMTQVMRDLHKAGYAYINGADGRPICGECGRYLVEEVGCPVCSTNEQAPTLPDYIIDLRLQLLKDPGLHPDNDFMPGETHAPNNNPECG